MYEGAEKDFDYNNGGENYDWSTRIILLKEKTQQNGFKKALKRMMKGRQKVQTLIYLRCVHYL